MRILLVNDLPVDRGDGRGGVEVHVRRLADGLNEAGHDVELVDGVITHRGLGVVADLWDPAALRAVRARADAFGADVVHVHNFARELSASVFLIGRERPLVHTVHDRFLVVGPNRATGAESAVVLWAKAIKARVDRRVVRRHAHAVVAVSDSLAHGLRARGFRDVTVIRGIVPPRASLGPLGDDILFVGRLTAEKRPDIAIRAFARVQREFPASRLHLVGDGPLERDLRTLVTDLELDDRVLLHGHLDEPEVHALLAKSRVAIAPSGPEEAFGLVVAESLIAGRPVVCSDIEPFREQVQSERHGWFAPVDDVDAFAGALREALADPAEATARGNAGSVAARMFTTPAVVERHLDVYAEAIRRQGSA